jgi:hypothetical protein
MAAQMMTAEERKERRGILSGYIERALRARDVVGLFREAVRAAAFAHELRLFDEERELRDVIGRTAAWICAEIEPAEVAALELREKLTSFLYYIR